MHVSSKWFMNRLAYIGAHFVPMATPKICKKSSLLSLWGGNFIEETIGLPGWFSLYTLGGSFRVGVFGLCDFKPSAIYW